MASVNTESAKPGDMSLGHFGVPEFGWRVPLDHEFPEKWGALKYLRFLQMIKLIPTICRYFKFIQKMKALGRRPFIDIVPVSFKRIYGVPIGGIGCGAINRGWKGEFCRWSLTPGIYTYDIVEVNQFTVRIQRPDQPVYQQVLYPGQVSSQHLAQSWQWQFPGNQAQYHGLYPRAWTVYRIPDQDVTLVCRQVSSVFPHDYSDTCLPVGVFVWEIHNHAPAPVDVSIMFTWQNGIGAASDRNGGRWNEAFCTEGAEGSSEASVVGVLLHDDQPINRCTMGISAASQEGVKVTHCAAFNPSANADALWEDLLEDGHLNSSTDPAPKSQEGELTAAAVCASCQVGDKSQSKMEFVLAWDMPRVHFKSKGQSYLRRYTRWFGQDGKAAPRLCSHALRNYPQWEEAIESWQRPILEEDFYPAWYKSALFNELYFMSDGGSVWLELQEDRANGSPAGSNSTPDRPCKMAKLRKDVGLFAYLEGHEYRMFNTYDVHFYASFALTMLWPRIEISLQDFIGSCVSVTDDESYSQLANGKQATRKLADCIPHDIGDPEEEPWKRINGYYQHDTCQWKDLNLKFVLMIYRDFYQIQDLVFLREMYPKCKTVMETAKLQDIDDDGLIDNSGMPDQTYDAWVMTGASAYCGGLWLAALRCMVEMAHILGHDTDASEYSAILDKGKVSYEAKLWNGKYYNYDSSHSPLSQTCMADQLAGQWYLRACNLARDQTGADIFPANHVRSALETVYRTNVLPFREGRFGAVNGVKPNGRIDCSTMQSEEVWTGVTYGLAASMIQEGLVKEGFQTASGIYHTCYERAGLGFQTPEAIMLKQAFRSSGYMRPLAIWAMQWALENRHKQAALEDAVKSPGENCNGNI
ncbi:non-lysosomal glucosylceramidase-like [Acanthaster planci]|uniref:Non-lysosomal glucosylceramidase n=1 Tax=Acanthaster planci TaxID=133434 RepID=A0A8B7ZJN8_ACAPL|nr:non-lysosomal glucosylceramidase-like [Acanthaster planci]XP_022105237.1 non-lysosomal glucosylceramidase-like [Acanthaster planci]XP_022105238.1 non-lysosomal glucosylceramidase-like [Acanthaster planci]